MTLIEGVKHVLLCRISPYKWHHFEPFLKILLGGCPKILTSSQRHLWINSSKLNIYLTRGLRIISTCESWIPIALRIPRSPRSTLKNTWKFRDITLTWMPSVSASISSILSYMYCNDNVIVCSHELCMLYIIDL